MVVAKHLPPIQPYPVQHDTPVHIAPSDGGYGSDATKKRQGGSRKGLVIRTSKHWVLPPRPKPGRKPSERRRAASLAPAAGPVTTPASVISTSTSGQSVPVSGSSAASASVSIPPGTPVSPGTSSIKKDLSKLPIRSVSQFDKADSSTSTTSISVSTSGNNANNDNVNNIVEGTNALTPCVSPSPPKRTKTSLKREIQHIKSENTKLKQELGLLVGNLQELKQKCKQVETRVDGHDEIHDNSNNDDNDNINCSHKRHLDESLAFLKFEDDEEELPPLLSSNRMNHSSSVSSRTNSTDEEDLLTVSSTPNSLFSLDLQHSHSSLSSCSRSLSKSSPMNEKSQLRFFDTSEQFEFNEKHVGKSTTSSTTAPSIELPLSSIKEEESDQFPWIDPVKEEASILDFLQTRQDIWTNPINGEEFFDNGIKNNDNGNNNCINDNNGKDNDANNDDNDNTVNDDLFRNLSLAALPRSRWKTSATTTSACYVSPSLEELMEEQDGGFVNSSNANATLAGMNDCDDDFDMLRTQVFDMA